MNAAAAAANRPRAGMAGRPAWLMLAPGDDTAYGFAVQPGDPAEGAAPAAQRR